MNCVQEYSTHSDEDNPDRIEQIMQRAVVDVDWIAKKARLTCMHDTELVPREKLHARDSVYYNYTNVSFFAVRKEMKNTSSS